MTKEDAIEILTLMKRQVFAESESDNALDMAIEALEKQIPIAPETDDYGDAICPKCGEEVVEWTQYCENCGSAISWRDWL